MVRRLLLSFALLAATAVGSQAADQLSPAQLSGIVRSEALTIPTPGEFFVAVDKQGQPNWKQIFQPLVPEPTASREHMALLLGALVADGYLAVEAQDSQGVKNTGKDILNLAKKLNVSQSILGRGNSINDFAENNDWAVLREELEATQNEVKIAMTEQKDKDLVILVTLGAWIRGTAVAAAYISKNNTPELAALLRQPAILRYMLDRLAELPEAARAEPLMAKVRAGLEKLLAEVDTPAAEPLSPARVDAVAATSAALVTLIAQKGETP